MSSRALRDKKNSSPEPQTEPCESSRAQWHLHVSVMAPDRFETQYWVGHSFSMFVYCQLRRVGLPWQHYKRELGLGVSLFTDTPALHSRLVNQISPLCIDIQPLLRISDRIAFVFAYNSNPYEFGCIYFVGAIQFLHSCDKNKLYASHKRKYFVDFWCNTFHLLNQGRQLQTLTLIPLPTTLGDQKAFPFYKYTTHTHYWSFNLVTDDVQNHLFCAFCYFCFSFCFIHSLSLICTDPAFSREVTWK